MRGSNCVKGALCALFLCTGIISSAAGKPSFRGEKTLGMVLGYCGSNRCATAGLEFSYRFNRWFRVAPEADYVFRRHGRDALLLSVNTQYPLMFHHDTMDFYPQLGLTYSSWNYHFDKSDPAYDEASTLVSRFGVNVGAGYEVNMTSSLRLGFNAGYLIVKDYSCFECGVRIAYRF